jgi:hypothetical protein
MTDMPVEGNRARLRIAADVGGTFTDIATFDVATGVLGLAEALTTPTRLVEGISHGVDRAVGTFAEAGLFLHGTTVAINALLVDEEATNVLRIRMRALRLPGGGGDPGFEEVPSASRESNFGTWSAEAKHSADKRRIVIAPDDADDGRLEIQKWESEIRWAGLLRVRCGCC